MMNEIVRNIDFSEENIIYLLLNIIGHDVIHDFYGNLGKVRWNAVKTVVAKFKSDSMTFGGRKRTFSEYDSVDGVSSESGTQLPTEQYVVPRNLAKGNVVEDIPPSVKKQKLTLTTGTTESSAINEFINTNYEFNRFTQDIANSILYNYFYYNLSFNSKLGGGDEQDSLQSNIENCKLFFMQSQNDFNMNDTFDIQLNYQNLYNSLAEQFIKFCNENSANNAVTKDYKYFFDMLNNFFNDDNLFKITVFDILSGEENNNAMEGGASNLEEMTNEELVKIIENAETVYNNIFSNSDSGLNQLASEITNIVATKNYNRYAELRQQIIKKLVEVFDVKNNPQAYGIINGNTFIIPFNDNTSNNKYFNKVKTDPNYLKSEFTYQFNEMLKPYKLQYSLNQPKKSRVKSATFGYDVKEKYIEFIIKSALYLTGCCDKNGNINMENELMKSIFSGPNDFNNDLRNQITILRSIGFYNEDEDFEVVGSDTSHVIKKLANREQAFLYDDYLMNFIIKKYYPEHKIDEESGLRYICSDIKQTYVVNNAGSFRLLGKKLSERVMCPYSSIVDGMISCSYSSAVKYNTSESGNMNFMLRKTNDSSIGYNGKSMLTSDTDMVLNLNIKMPLLTVMSNLTMDVTQQKSDLIAHTVLKRTLVFITDFIRSQNDQNVLDNIFTGGQIFENLFKIAIGDIDLNTVNYELLQANNLMDTSDNKNMNIFNAMLNNIVQKGIGDIFQEINSVCKYGGYTMENYNANDNVLSLNTETGNQTRFFIATDRPSSARFVFILSNGSTEQINTKAYGGMSTETRLFIFKQNQSIDVCEPELVTNMDIVKTGGNKSKSLKNKLRIRKRKTNRKNKHKSNHKKHTKKMKKNKKNRNTRRN